MLRKLVIYLLNQAIYDMLSKLWILMIIFYRVGSRDATADGYGGRNCETNWKT